MWTFGQEVVLLASREAGTISEVDYSDDVFPYLVKYGPDDYRWHSPDEIAPTSSETIHYAINQRTIDAVEVEEVNGNPSTSLYTVESTRSPERLRDMARNRVLSAAHFEALAQYIERSPSPYQREVAEIIYQRDYASLDSSGKRVVNRVVDNYYKKESN